jgi:hypothetical protein
LRRPALWNTTSCSWFRCIKEKLNRLLFFITALRRRMRHHEVVRCVNFLVRGAAERRHLNVLAASTHIYPGRCRASGAHERSSCRPTAARWAKICRRSAAQAVLALSSFGDERRVGQRPGTYYGTAVHVR